MNKMTWAKFHPKKTLMRDSIPPPGTDRWTRCIVTLMKFVEEASCNISAIPKRNRNSCARWSWGSSCIPLATLHSPNYCWLFARFHVQLFREDPAFKKMVSLCRDSTYTEFFWFPNRGTEEGYWENCWIDDGNEEDAVDINESVADEYQVIEYFLLWQSVGDG